MSDEILTLLDRAVTALERQTALAIEQQADYRAAEKRRRSDWQAECERQRIASSATRSLLESQSKRSEEMLTEHRAEVIRLTERDRVQTELLRAADERNGDMADLAKVMTGAKAPDYLPTEFSTVPDDEDAAR